MISGYANRWAARAGEDVLLHAASDSSTVADVSLVRLDGDTDSLTRVDGMPKHRVTLRPHESRIGSFLRVADPDDRFPSLRGTVVLFAWVGCTGQSGTLLAKSRRDRARGFEVGLDDTGAPSYRAGDGSRMWSERLGSPLTPQRWHALAFEFDAETRMVRCRLRTAPSAVRSPGSGRWATVSTTKAPAAWRQAVGAPIAVGGVLSRWGNPDTATDLLNAKVAAPALYAEPLGAVQFDAYAAGRWPEGGLISRWDFAREIGRDGVHSDRITDVGPATLDGCCCNNPKRAVTGPFWRGTEQRFSDAPQEFDAIHFHREDLDDIGWEPTVSVRIPEGFDSGIYAFSLESADGEDQVPFIVSPRRSSAHLALLLPVASYQAYANNRTPLMAADSQPVLGHVGVIGETELDLLEHPEFGLSLYDSHADGSGVCVSSRHRPMLEVRPNHRSFITAGPWQFAADLEMARWLGEQGYNYDVLCDEDLHHRGVEMLRPFRAVITGSHPEYVSAQILEALELYVEGGGRLVYPGANGFYWVIAYHPGKPHLMEVRRGIAGSSAWRGAPGEHFHAFTGEFGGLWRDRAQPPHALVGVGFAAEGFSGSSHYRRLPDSFDERVSFIFEGIDTDELIGQSEQPGVGAAGIELDRFDPLLGSPEDALVLASSEGHGSDYLRVVEEIAFNAPGFDGVTDPAVRADMVYVRRSGGGAVFSTGSIAWTSALLTDVEDNNVARITNNVLRRFLLAGPLP